MATAHSHQFTQPKVDAQTWADSAEAEALLARISPEDLHVKAVTPLFGQRSYAWTAGEVTEALQAARSAWIVDALGLSAIEACAAGRKDEFVALYNSQPLVEDVLADRFGNPDALAAVPQWCINGDGITASLTDSARQFATINKGHRAFVRGVA
jgi:hypothetical protein